MTLKLLTNLSFYIPEVIAIFTMCALLFIESAYKPGEKGRKLVYVTTIIGLLITSFMLCKGFSDKPLKIFADAVVIDHFSTLIKLIMTLSTLAIVYISFISKDIYDSFKSEFIIMAIGVLIGGMLLASANNLLTVYIGIETLSILSYVMASMKRYDTRSNEAGLKYVLYGGIASGIMLYGMSHIFGVVGSIQFEEIAKVTMAGSNHWVMIVSFVMFFVGLGYKIAAAPFHMWSPDVYQGSPIPVTSFFSIIPKMAGIAAIIRISMVFFSTDSAITHTWLGILTMIAATTMTVGNVSAIGQDSVKRMLAYSSIAHAGMMLLGVLVVNPAGVQAVLFYGITYMFMTICAFLITAIVVNKTGSDSMSSFKGLINKHPFMGVCMIIVLFSLAGIPPLSGFMAKFHIFNVVINKGFYVLAFIAAINSVIGLYYYMKLVKVMVFEESEFEEPIEGFTFVNQLVICACAAPVVFLGIFWEGIMKLAHSATVFIQ
jgi:NADH-quinone oxidoreductase subunit N